MNFNNLESDKIAETIRGQFNFSVEKWPTHVHDHENFQDIPTGKYALVRNDAVREIVGSDVTDRYTPHTTEDVLALTDAASRAFEGDVDLKCYWNKGHYVSIAPTRDYRRSVFGSEDNIFPRVLISAGYDGKAFQAAIGYYRDLCSNMAMLRMVNGTNVKIKHTHSLRGKIDDLIVQMQGLREGWNNLSDTIMSMQNREVNLTEFLKELYGEPESGSTRSETIYRNRAESIYTRVWRERRESGRERLGATPIVSAWEAFNGVQGYTQHDKSRNGKPQSFQRMLTALDDKDVTRASELALAM